ncbi:MAG: PqqD family protein [Lachnospiraceae bacterium]|nr:PqqD family protein [Lachnospiraceae bacterium]
MVRKVAGMYYLFREKSSCELEKPVVLNEMGYFIYTELKRLKSLEEIAQEISEKYAAPYDDIYKDVESIQKMLVDVDLLDE